MSAGITSRAGFQLVDFALGRLGLVSARVFKGTTGAEVMKPLDEGLQALAPMRTHLDDAGRQALKDALRARRLAKVGDENLNWVTHQHLARSTAALAPIRQNYLDDLSRTREHFWTSLKSRVSGAAEDAVDGARAVQPSVEATLTSTRSRLGEFVGPTLNRSKGFIDRLGH